MPHSITTPEITICIATKNRPAQFLTCLKSLHKNFSSEYELVVADSSTSANAALNRASLYKIFNNRFFYIPIQHHGLSYARNKAIESSRAPFVAFTDDDCIVSNTWLSEIQKVLQISKVDAVFGQTHPYKPKTHKGLHCPSTIFHKKFVVHQKPVIHYKNIGFGNNMAYRKSIFKKIGLFKTWLGPGSVGSNADDAEMALRLLVSGGSLAVNPHMVVYHNRWIDKNETTTLSLSYVGGEMTCYSYFFFQAYPFAAPIVKKNLSDSLQFLKNIFLLKRKLLTWENFSEIKFLYIRLRGLLLGYYFSKFDSVPKNT